MDEATRLTEAEVNRALVAVFRDVSQTMQRIGDRSMFGPVEPGSSLAGDDAATDPYQLSHGVIAAIGGAVEHMDTIRALMMDAKVLHPRAPFTIARAGIEAGAAAVWLLGPPKRADRVVRRCQQMLQDGRDGDKAVIELGLPLQPPPHEREERLADLARRATGNRRLRLDRPSTTSTVQFADSHVDSPLAVLAAWRVCAAFSHGRLWSTLAVLDQQRVESDSPDVVNALITSSLERILWPVSVAHRVVVAAARLYEQRRRRHHH